MKKIVSKRMKILLICCILLVTTGFICFGTNGDANNNGSIDINDALLVARYAAGLPASGFVVGNADANCDHSVNINDALVIARYAASMGTICPGTIVTPTPTPTATPTTTSNGPNTMGFCGCSMAENVAQGYQAVGGRRMWPAYGTGGMVVQNWTNPGSSSWQLFDQQVAKYGKPNTVWVQICIFPQGATYDEVKQMIAAARQHAATGAKIYITGQPLYPEGNVCALAGGADGPASTDRLAQQAANDASQNVTYAGTFTLKNSEVQDGCHANTAGQQALGNQAVAKWGK
jgi:hypothetical protein